MYYLNSRYYNPEIGRFINADGQIGSVGDILGHNMYAYAMNNPVMMVDPSGYLPQWAKNVLIGSAIIVGVALVAAVVISTGPAGAAFIPLFLEGLQTEFAIAGTAAVVSGTIRAGRSIAKHSSDDSSFGEMMEYAGESFLDGFGDGFLAGAEYYAATASLATFGSFTLGYANFGSGFGYGYIGDKSMALYHEPNVVGFNFYASKTGNKFRIEVDALHSIHYHSGPSKKARQPHKGAWYGGIVVGFFSGISGEVY